MDGRRVLQWLLAVGMLLLGWWLGNRFGERQLLEADARGAYPATDWVRWEKVGGRLVATGILPPASANPYLRNQYIQPGDELVSVDYQRIYEPEVLRQVIGNSPPGSVLLYQLRRQSPERFQAESIERYVVTGYEPLMMTSRSSWSWNLSFVLSLLLVAANLVVFVLLLPFFRRNLLQNLPSFSIIGLTLLLTGLQAVRHILLLLDTRFELLGFERPAAIVLMLAFLFYSVILGAEMPGTRRSRILSLLPAALVAGGLATFLALKLGPDGHTALYAPLVEGGILLVFTLQLAHFLIAHWRLHRPRRRWWEQAAFGAGAGLTLWIGLVFVMRLNGASAPLWTWSGWDLGVHLGLIPPLILTTAPLVRFGKVNRVLTQSLTYLAVLAMLISLYLVIHSLLEDFAPDTTYRGLLELSLVLILALAGRWVLVRYGSRLLELLNLRQRQREQQFDHFLTRIPRYTNSDSLVEDLRHHIAQYLNSPLVHIWPNLPGKTDPPANFRLPLLERMSETLAEREGIWTASKELSTLQFDAATERRILAMEVGLVFPLRYSSGPPGLILLGSPPHRVFNLSDLELLSRAVQQTQLTLEVLHLLEREKILAEKTMEANMTALRSQINPHFLFNTLNTISSLIHDSPDAAEAAVERLAFVFRHTLKFSRENYVRLENELQLVRSVLDIEKMRFGERLETSIEVQPEANEFRIPALVIQTVMENSIKHGISKIMETGRIQLAFWLENDCLRGYVEDNGPGIDPDRVKKGTGLKNVILRLEELYGRKDTITFTNTGAGTRVNFYFPPPPDAAA